MRIKVKNFLDTLESFLRSNATAVREWVLPDRDITIAGTDDVETVQNNVDTVAGALSTHIADTANPHGVTKSQVGLGNVDNTSDANKPVSSAQAIAIGTVQSDLNTHKADTANPHGVTKSQVGLGNVDNTSDANKPVSSAQQTALDLKVNTSRTVNGHPLTADVTVTKSDIGLGNVDNTSDANKPVSSATQTALDLKVNESNRQQFMLVNTLRNFYNY